MAPQVAFPCSHSTRVSTVSYDTVSFVGLQHREQLQPCTWIKVYTLRCTPFSRPKGASGSTDEDFVFLSLRACLSLHVTHKTAYGGGHLVAVPCGGYARVGRCSMEGQLDAVCPCAFDMRRPSVPQLPAPNAPMAHSQAPHARPGQISPVPLGRISPIPPVGPHSPHVPSSPASKCPTVSPTSSVHSIDSLVGTPVGGFSRRSSGKDKARAYVECTLWPSVPIVLLCPFGCPFGGLCSRPIVLHHSDSGL